MTYSGIFEETDCKKELERAKKFIKKQENIIFALEKEIEQKENEIKVLKNGS
jgi:RecA/RadA recombinase